MSKKSRVSFKLPPLGPQHAKQAVNKQQQQIANPVTRDQATAEITRVVEQSGMPPQMFAEIGQLAEAAIKDKKAYKNFVKYMVEKRLETAEELKKPDYQMLASLAVIGKVAATMSPTQSQVNPTVEQPVAPEGI